ncbi:alginate lyase family protein [Lederbergia citrea]|uniref:Alginate lyase family protein n=1 Tax=Lederbergia citrea TaxID=2833581 RepID=A0A942Z4R8_9BACI|nr:alginate lyase family protein [Lederbergia citrea]MBS4176692.1 alginate lyase family protein [Lederbergia citrea]MBS4203253.1 alginate lyase family protein [Lederbergia citrea]MBS4222076.1 alginate lyase family protein [Lederbergia citrea]
MKIIINNHFILYRIIGNDLHPRHKKGQSRENLKFVLENEAELENCEKKWVVNRIIDRDEEKEIIELLQHHNQQFIHLPFLEDEYRKIGWDTDCLPKPGYLASKDFESLNSEIRKRVIAATYRLKNNYVMNINGARNAALRDGKSRGKWILPWDGNCFITQTAWKQICTDVLSSSDIKYFTVPMTRVIDNAQLLTDEFIPNPVEEPQIIFRNDSLEEFNEQFCYGRRDKVELFWRLGIQGKWDNWKDDPWDQNRGLKSAEANQFGAGGWVARMYSGMEKLEKDSKKSFKQRGLARIDAIISTIRHLDTMVSRRKNSSDLLTYQSEVLNKERNNYQNGEQLPPVERLINDAKEALTRGPYSVTDKSTLPPSGLIHDYWHPAPYWWPNPKKKDGLPYIWKDGQRVPGTKLYEPESDKYDRTRIQRVFDDSITLALACFFTGDKKYAEHGASIFHQFFINQETRMSPHLKYAQVRMGHKKNTGTSRGIIELKDMYFYLDAVRILYSAGAIAQESLNSFKEWLSNYLDWLIQSPQGKEERKALNNHGIYYDIQVAAIADFLHDESLLFETLVRAQSRIATHITSDGLQPEEQKRQTSAHYCFYNMQGWIYMAQIASRWGTNLWSYEAPNGASLIKGIQWLFSQIGEKWPFKQIDDFNLDRYLPIWFSIPQSSITLPTAAHFPKSKYLVNPRFFADEGVRPYWNLGLNDFSDSNAVEKKTSDIQFSLKKNLNNIEEYFRISTFNEENKQKPEIAFAISLKSKTVSHDWEKVQKNLALTLRSLFSNTDQNFRVIIAGHEKPNIEELNNIRVTWVPVKFPPPKSSRGFVSDKYRKRKAIGAYLRKSGFSGYFMPLDADDWIHYRFVEYIRSLPISDAFILNKGFMVNVFQNEAWVRDLFYKGCGSSAVFYFSNENFPKTTKSDVKKSPFNNVIKSHVKVPEYVKNHTMIDLPFVTWVLAHGDNVSMIKGKKDNRISAKHYNSVGEKLADWFYHFFKIKE